MWPRAISSGRRRQPLTSAGRLVGVTRPGPREGRTVTVTTTPVWRPRVATHQWLCCTGTCPLLCHCWQSVGTGPLIEMRLGWRSWVKHIFRCCHSAEFNATPCTRGEVWWSRKCDFIVMIHGQKRRQKFMWFEMYIYVIISSFIMNSSSDCKSLVEFYSLFFHKHVQTNVYLIEHRETKVAS